MRTISLSGGGVSGTASIPDSVVYAFNPNYVTISVGGFTGILKLAVSDGSKSFDIDVTVFKGSAKVYISRLLQILFDNYVSVRSKSVTLTLSTDDGTAIGSGSMTVLWAALEAGMTYGYYLPIASDVNWAGRAIREIVWFKNLPQVVSVFSGSAIVDKSPASVSEANIRLIPCTDMEGTYLRWIDCYGFWQYYLFDTGQRQSKNKLSNIAIDAEYSIGGVSHQAQRNIHVENADTIKCCAVNMKKEVLAYVETIYKSPHIEMYVGKVGGTEVWKPVNITAGTADVHPDNKLFDYEISFTLPETQVQTI